MLDLDFWYGLVLYEDPQPCSSCRREITGHALAVANGDDEVLHIRCAVRHGWSPSDTEAWAIALYGSTPAVAL